MPNYIVNRNAQPNGDNEVHQYPRWNCTSPDYPAVHNQVQLGYFAACSGAVSEAKRLGYSKANGCFYCANACHTS